jgi:hypothetical protein
MAKARQELHLELPPGEVAEIAERVVAALGWELSEEEEGQLVVDEDMTKLHCHCSPLRAELELHSAPERGTRLLVEGRVPGWGPVASQHVRRQTDLLTRRVGLEAVDAMRARRRGA